MQYEVFVILSSGSCCDITKPCFPGSNPEDVDASL